MASLTAEQIEQKKQQLKQLISEAEAIHKELVEAGADEFSDDELSQIAGGVQARIITLGGGIGEWGPKKKKQGPSDRYPHII